MENLVLTPCVPSCSPGMADSTNSTTAMTFRYRYPDSDEVLIRVGAAGINNTDINTRIGWYSKGVATDTHQGGADGFETADSEDASWQGVSLSFPRIQGADCCGRIVAVGTAVDESRIGERVIVRNMLRSYVDYRPFECWTLGSECDGAFAEFVKAPARETYAVNCDWTDAELASIPCAYSTAENMLHRASLSSGERVLITGASGRSRFSSGAAWPNGAVRRLSLWRVKPKSKRCSSIGAQRVIDRGERIVDTVGRNTVDVVVDLVAGTQWPELLDVLKVGGRYACAGAIAGPIVQLDVRTLYLKDLSLLGCTFQDDIVFENLVNYIEHDEIRPLVAETYPLSAIIEAQKKFLKKEFVGKLVLMPDD